MNILLKVSIQNMARHKDRTSFTILGLALALGVLFFVYNISAAYQGNVSNSFNYLTRGGVDLWVTPVQGFTFDSQSQLIFTNGSLPYGDYASVERAASNGTLAGGTVVYAELVNTTMVNGHQVVIWGTTRLSNSSLPLTVLMNQQAASAFGVSAGASFTIAGRPAVFSQSITDLATTYGVAVMPLSLASELLDQVSSPPRISWMLVKSPLYKQAAQWTSSGLNYVLSTSPTATVTPGSRGIVFALPAGFYRYQVVSFSSQLSAISLSRVVGTSYGLLANISLGLGFVLVLSTAILNMEERRRELGIWSALGIAEDAFFVFLIETILVYVAAMSAGFFLGVGLISAFAPWTLELSNLGRTFLVIIPYFPILVIVGSLIPLQLLLSKKPLDLLLKR
jgi:hypothetical protein